MAEDDAVFRVDLRRKSQYSEDDELDIAMLRTPQHFGMISGDSLVSVFCNSFLQNLVADSLRLIRTGCCPAQWSRTILWAFVAVLMVVRAPSSFGQFVRPEASDRSGDWYVGYNGFRMLLEEQGLTIRRDLILTTSTPSESVVVMFGDLSRVSRPEWLQLRRYVDQGGSLLVASEQSFLLPGVSRFYPGPVSTQNVADRYQGFEDCIGLNDLSATHPLTKGLREIVVNKSGWLTLPDDDSLNWEVVAALPEDCQPLAARGNPVLMAGLGTANREGVFVLAADQSLFSDGMLWHGDNSLLAIQAAELLCRGKRRWLTVYENGQSLGSIHQTANQPKPMPPVPSLPTPPLDVEPPEPDLPTMLKLANAVIDEVQDSNIVNKTLNDRPRNVRPVAWLRTMLLVLLIAATLFVLWKLVQNRWHLIPHQHSRFLQSMYGVYSSNQLATSEFGSALEVLSRDLCREITGSVVETEWVKMLSGGKGTAVSALPRSLQKRMAEILGIAIRGCRIHVSRKKFQSLGRTIDDLRKRHRQHPLVNLKQTV